MKNPMQPIDLRESVLLGIEHIFNSVDRERDCRPYFRFNLISPPVWSQHEAADTPHTVGRFLHAINVCHAMVGLPDDTELLEGLRKQIFASCDHNDGFAWDDMGGDSSPPLAYMHHQREALLALIAVWRIWGDPQAERYAKALVAAMEKTTRATGTYPGRCLGPDGWQEENIATTTSERAIGALVAYSHTFDDSLGIDLALRFARHALAVSFGENGELTPTCGTHIHSITGTIASLAELGLVTGEREFTDRARLIFDVGMLPYRTSTGWVKESVNAKYGRGEANCTADLIEAACLLGASGYSSYFEDAERMLCNHLLASQMDDLSWVVENEGRANTEKRAYEGLRRRARGAFCFGEPNGFHSYNSDLTGAALQGIAAAWEHIITCEDNHNVRVNLLLSREHEAVNVINTNTNLVVEVKRPIEMLSIRIPPWCESLRATIDGNAIPTTRYHLKVDQVREGAQVKMSFDRPQFLTQERAVGYENPYRIQWSGNIVTAMDGAGKHMALYPALEPTE